MQNRIVSEIEGGLAGSDLGAFEARLAARTRVPVDRVNEYIGWSEERLRCEAAVANRVLRRFAEAVVSSVENPASADEFLRVMDLKAVSRDHDWRAIFSTIRVQEVGVHAYKRAVLIKYLEYLSFRKRLLEFVYAKVHGLEETAEMDRTALAAGHGGGGMHPDFERLPLGEPVEVRLVVRGAVEIMVAAHRMRIEGASQPAVVDQNGVTHFLRRGRNIVGRHPESDVLVDPAFSDVSRAHAIVEWAGDARVRIQDLSSRGTFVHRAAIGSAGPPA